jgi:hypothetical protein
MDMAFFLIGRGADDALQLLSANSFESRQDAMAELSRITSDSGFAHWDLEVFVVDLDAGVPVLLVRPRAEEGADAPSVAEKAEAVASDESVTAVSEEVPTPPDETEAAAPEEVCEETSTDLREALQRTAQQMSAEGIVAPPSAGLEPESAQSEAEEADSTMQEAASEEDAEPAASEEPPAEPEDASEEAAAEAADEEAAGESAEAATQPADEQSWPWDAAPAATAAEPGVSPEIATVYEGLEEMDDADAVAESAEPAGPADQAVGSDFILDLEAIQPVALQPQGSDAAAPPEQPVESAESSLAEDTVVSSVPEPAQDDSGEAGFPSSMTEYTCEDCVYVETCPNRDQREPKDCGSFQWK